MRTRVRWYEWLLMAAASNTLVGFAYFGWFKWEEVFGFVTGGVCVWLVVRQHILNFPFGLANNVGFFVLFLSSRLYADMGLQVVFFVLGVVGWWNWASGRTNQKPLKPTHASWGELAWVVTLVWILTFALRELLLQVNGAAPFWDSFTTALSLAAQYLLIRKRIEHWYLWILADIIYVPLYLDRELRLTAVLYAVFLVLCVVGLVQWWQDKGRPSA
jgi:nicotinamide mononucleotide transporter